MCVASVAFVAVEADRIENLCSVQSPAGEILAGFLVFNSPFGRPEQSSRCIPMPLLMRQSMEGKVMENELREYFRYDPTTGHIFWTKDRSSNARAGNVAGTPNDQGYISIRLAGLHLKAHRVAWFLTFGSWPKDQIDHINGDPSDNRLCNLREASHRENLLNRRRRKSAPGLKGVSPGRRGKFRAAIRLDGKYHNLGEFVTPEAAHSAYAKAAKRLHGEFSSLS